MSITPRQKQLIQQSFAKVEPIADDAARIFYGKLFEYDPNLRELFKGSMKQQGQKLMATLKVAVNTLDNLDKLVPVLQQLAIKHVDYGVKVDDYTPVGNALLFALKTGLGNEFTDEVKEAWRDLYIVVADVMRSAAYPNYSQSTYKNRKQYAK